MTCKLNADTTDGLKIVSDTSGEIEIQDNGATRLTVGDTSTFATDLTVTTAGSGVTDILKLTTTASNTVPSILFNSDIGGTQHDVGRIRVFQGSSSTGGIIFETENSGSLAERARIDTDGVFMSQSTAAYVDGTIGKGAIQVDGRFGNRVGITIRAKNGDGSAFVTSASGMMGFVNGNGTVGTINTNGSGTSFNTTSDYRLKENVDYSFDATTRLKQLKPARFNFIADADTTVDGFLAHEVSSIVPEAITGTKDAEITTENNVINANGHVIDTGVEEADWTAGKANGTYPSDSTWASSATKPNYQSIDQSKLVPLLVKTIQELEARITALESE